MAAVAYGSFALSLAKGDIDFDTATIKVALTTSAYTPNVDTHDFFDDVTNELSTGGGYTAGGATLASVTSTYDAANNRVVIDAADPSWPAATFTCRSAVFYVSTGVAGTSRLISCHTFDADQTVTANTFTLILDALGILTITV